MALHLLIYLYSFLVKARTASGEPAGSMELRTPPSMAGLCVNNSRHWHTGLALQRRAHQIQRVSLATNMSPATSGRRKADFRSCPRLARSGPHWQ